MNFGSLITKLAGWRGYALVAVFALGIGGWAAMQVQGAFYKAEIAGLKEAAATQAAEQARSSLAEIVRLQDIIKGIDEDGYKSLMASKVETDRLQLDLASGARSLSARVTSCQRVVPPGSGMDDGTSIARLDETTSRNLAAIAADGDRAIIKMTGLQQYARLCEKTLRLCEASNFSSGDQ